LQIEQNQDNYSIENRTEDKILVIWFIRLIFPTANYMER
jgi:hypothetical protein